MLTQLFKEHGMILRSFPHSKYKKSNTERTEKKCANATMCKCAIKKECNRDVGQWLYLKASEQLPFLFP